MISQKGLVPVLIVLILTGALILASGAYYLGTKKIPTSQISQTTPTPEFSPAPTGTAGTNNWKTYINTKRGYSFKYPDSYQLEVTEASSNSYEAVILEKDVEATIGGGFGGGDALTKGSSMGFIFRKTDISDEGLRSQYGGQVVIENVKIGTKSAKKVTFPRQRELISYFIDYKTEILELSLSIGHETEDKLVENYIKEFDQIISTFKFLK